jgi:hypothetical protein
LNRMPNMTPTRQRTAAIAAGVAVLAGCAGSAAAAGGRGGRQADAPLPPAKSFVLPRLDASLQHAHGLVAVDVRLAANPVAAKAAKDQAALNSSLSGPELRILRRRARGGAAIARRHEAIRQQALAKLQPAANRAEALQRPLAAFVRHKGGRILARDVVTNTLTIRIPARSLRALARRQDVATVSLRPRFKRLTLSGPTLAVGAPTWWAAGHTGGTGSSDSNPIDLSIASDKINETHPAFAGQAFERASNLSADCTVDSASCPHGTGVASVAVSRGASGCALCVPADANEKGIASGVDKVLDDDDGPFGVGLTQFGIAGAPDPAEVVNGSYGGIATVDDNTTMQNADAYASLYGQLGVFSAGNDGPTGTASGNVSQPCTAYDVLCIGAISAGADASDPSDDTLTSYSSVGPSPAGRRKPELVAVGETTVAKSNYSTNLWTGGSGTSYSAPQVAGAAALLEGSGISSPLAVRSLLINSARPGRATGASAMGTQTGWQPDWGYGELDLSSAFAQRGNFHTATVAPGEPRFYRATNTAAGDRATLTWNRRATSCVVAGCMPSAMTLTNLDLRQLDTSTGALQTQSASTIDNTEQVRASGAGQVLYEVKASSSVDGLAAEPYAIASTRALTPLVTPRPTTQLTIGEAQARPGSDVAVHATVTNPSGDLAAKSTSVTLQLPAGVDLVSGSATQSAGDLAPNGSYQADWTVRGTSDGLKQLIAQADATAVDTAVSSSDAADVTVDGTPPTVTIAAPSGTTSNPSMNVSWGGQDTGAGVAAYDVDVAVDGGSFGPWLSATTSTSSSYSGASGHSYRFQVRATDRLGNTSTYVASDAVTVAATNPGPGPDPDPGPAPRSAVGLKLRSAKLTTRALTVRGSLARAATGKMALIYDVVVRHKHLRVRKSVHVRRGAFTATLRLPAQVRKFRSGKLTLRYGGDSRYKPRTIARRIKRGSR